MLITFFVAFCFGLSASVVKTHCDVMEIAFMFNSLRLVTTAHNSTARFFAVLWWCDKPQAIEHKSNRRSGHVAQLSQSDKFQFALSAQICLTLC